MDEPLQPTPAADRMARARAAKRAVLTQPPLEPVTPDPGPPLPKTPKIVNCEGVLQPPPERPVIISSYDLATSTFNRRGR